MIFKHPNKIALAIALLAVSASAFSPHKPAVTQSLVRLNAQTLKSPLEERPSPVEALQKQAQSAVLPDELIAQDDGGDVPTESDKKRVAAIKRNVVQVGKPLDQKLGIKQVLVFLEGLFVRGNRLPFRLFSAVRSATTVEYMALDHVDFTDDVLDTLFYQTAKSRLSNTLVGTFNEIFKFVPFTKPQAGTVDYQELIGPDFFEPFQRTMQAATAEDCFLKQTEAFCHPESPGSKRLVCDLGFLDKYQVNRKTTAGRYGGKAVVEGGKIVEVDGRRESNPDFERYKARFLSSFGVYVIVCRHAVMTHLAISQRLLIKLTAHRSEGYIDTWKDEKHRGPYTLLRALTTRTNEVSINEQLLIGPDRSLVQRATSFTADSLELMLSDYYEKYSNMDADELITDVARSGTGKWTKAVNAAWQGAQKVVNDICEPVLNDHVSKSDLKDLSLMLWVATFYHGFIGDFQLDNVNKGKLMLLHTGETDIPKEMELSYGTLATTIGVSTMTRTLQCQSLGAFFPEKDQQDAWRKYMDLLANLDVGVEGFSLDVPVYAAVNF